MTGPFMACRAALPGMMRRGAGKIVNTVSVLGELGRPWVVPYAAAKGGLRMLTRALATEVAGANIRFATDNEEPVMAGAVLAEVD